MARQAGTDAVMCLQSEREDVEGRRVGRGGAPTIPSFPSLSPMP